MLCEEAVLNTLCTIIAWKTLFKVYVYAPVKWYEDTPRSLWKPNICNM